jgi:hypothetical protein
MVPLTIFSAFSCRDRDVAFPALYRTDAGVALHIQRAGDPFYDGTTTPARGASA